MPGNTHCDQNWKEGNSLNKTEEQEHYYVGKGSHIRVFCLFVYFCRKGYNQSHALQQCQLHEDSNTLSIREREIKKMKKKASVSMQ